MADQEVPRRERLKQFRTRTREAEFHEVDASRSQRLRDSFSSGLTSETTLNEGEAANIAESVTFEVADSLARMSSPVGGVMTAQWDGSLDQLQRLAREYATNVADRHRAGLGKQGDK